MAADHRQGLACDDPTVGVQNGSRASREAPYQWQAHAWSVTKIGWIAGANCAESHRTDFGNVWHEMAQ
jgi:hypothetical protein